MIDSLGYRLKQLRQERKLKQGQVADIIGVNRTLDVSGLTRAEYTMIADLVESMSEKNKKLEDM